MMCAGGIRVSPPPQESRQPGAPEQTDYGQWQLTWRTALQLPCASRRTRVATLSWPHQWKKHADKHARSIHHGVRNGEGNQPAKAQIQERLEDRVRHRRQQAKSHKLRIKGQRHEDMLQRPGERYQCDRYARAPTKYLESGYQISVIGHLLGQPPDARKHEHAI